MKKKLAGWIRPTVGLRGLMALVLLIAAGLGWAIKGARDQRAAVAAVRRAGGYCVYDWETGSRLAPDGWRFTKPPGPDWVRAWLGADFLDTVEFVRFDSSRLDDQAIAELAEHLRRLPRLKSLMLDCNGATGASMRRIGTLKNLENLWIYGLSARDPDFEPIGRLSKLKELYLYGCPIGDAGMKHLARLPDLQKLSLTQTKVGDACVDDLCRMRRLTFLAVGGTSISPKGIQSLRSRLPGVEINLDP